MARLLSFSGRRQRAMPLQPVTMQLDSTHYGWSRKASVDLSNSLRQVNKPILACIIPMVGNLTVVFTRVGLGVGVRVRVGLGLGLGVRVRVEYSKEDHTTTCTLSIRTSVPRCIALHG
jgi:hypothetical protein